MEETKIQSINFIIADIQESVTSIWEELMDEDEKEAVKNIDEAMEKLKALKNNIVEKED